MLWKLLLPSDGIHRYLKLRANPDAESNILKTKLIVVIIQSSRDPLKSELCSRQLFQNWNHLFKGSWYPMVWICATTAEPAPMTLPVCTKPEVSSWEYGDLLISRWRSIAARTLVWVCFAWWTVRAVLTFVALFGTEGGSRRSGRHCCKLIFEKKGYEEVFKVSLRVNVYTL